jgi:hypothetical protein
MNSPPPSYVQQHPGLNSQPAQHALSIRTATPSTSQRGPPSSPAQPHPAYPISIPPSKFAKAVRLYTLFRYEEGLAQRHGPAHADPLLSPATAQSVTSRSSRVYTPSVSTSAYDGLTDRSSLVSFTEEESAPLGQGNGSTELIAYNGTRIKPRVRKPLSPTAKAKAALIRCLGSCTSCRNRRVPVSRLALSRLKHGSDCLSSVHLIITILMHLRRAARLGLKSSDITPRNSHPALQCRLLLITRPSRSQLGLSRLAAPLARATHSVVLVRTRSFFRPSPPQHQILSHSREIPWQGYRHKGLHRCWRA